MRRRDFLPCMGLGTSCEALWTAAQTETPVGPKPNEVKLAVLVNQAGFDTDRTKSLVVQIRDPQEARPGKFHLLDDSGRTVFSGGLRHQGRGHPGTPSDWGAAYWVGDFTRFTRAGRYRARVEIGAQKVESFAFRIEQQLLFRQTIEAAVGFFRWQRCGAELPGLHKACHLDDGRLPAELGGGHRNLTGGWHDAGDYNKYILNGGTPLAVYALSLLHRDSAVRLSEETRRAIIEEARWGADFLLRMRVPGKDTLLSCVFSGYGRAGAPERETDNVPNTTDDRPAGRGPLGPWPRMGKVLHAPSPLSAAALAVSAGTQGGKRYRQPAEDLWQAAVTALEPGGDTSWIDSQDTGFSRLRAESEILLADLELARLTGDSKYQSDAAQRVNGILLQQDTSGLWPSSLRGDGAWPASLALFAKSYPRHPASARCRAALKRWVVRNSELAGNPFNLIQWSERAVFFPYTNPKQWYVGQNSQYLSRAWALYLSGHLLDDQRCAALADRQLDWILGTNPFSVCMMEGQGSFHLPRYHHCFLGSRIKKVPPVQERGAVPGAVVNGITRVKPEVDRPFADFEVDNSRYPAYSSTEPWLFHNCYYILALLARDRLVSQPI